MAVATATRTEVSQEQSLALMKNSVRASVGEICWLRNLFPHELFKDCKFGSTNVRALVAKDPATNAVLHEDAVQLAVFMEAALEAVEKKYLRSIVLGIYSPHEDPTKRVLLESYVFHFKYPGTDEVEATLQTDSESFTLPRVREDAMVMIRRLIRLMETLKPLPYKKVLTFKLFYYDDATPQSYNPPHYKDSTHDVHPFFAAPPFKVAIGAVGSKHHSLTLKVAFSEGDQTEEPVEKSQQTATVEKVAPIHEAKREKEVPESKAEVSVEIDVSHLPPGVDPSIYKVARKIVINENVCTLKGLLQHLRNHADEEHLHDSIDITNESARRILKCLETEGILVGRAGNRYEMAEAYIKPQSEADESNEEESHCAEKSTREGGATTTVKHVTTPAHHSRSTTEDDVSQNAPLEKARIMRARALCLINNLQDTNGDPAKWITVSKFSGILSCDESVARVLLEKISNKGVVATTAAVGKGFEILRQKQSYKFAISEAIAFLDERSLLTPELADKTSVSGKKRSRETASGAENSAPKTHSHVAEKGTAPPAIQTVGWSAVTPVWVKSTDKAAGTTAPGWFGCTR